MVISPVCSIQIMVERHNDKRNDDFWIDFSSIERSRIEPLSTGAVEDAVEENFETYPKDSACEDKDCTEAEEDWASSTAQRSFYGWSVTNLDDVMGTGAAPTYEKVGPVTYDITTTKTINAYDKDAGTLTYNSVKTFECAADSEVSCDTEITQLNIAFQTQVIGATGIGHQWHHGYYKGRLHGWYACKRSRIIRSRFSSISVYVCSLCKHCG